MSETFHSSSSVNISIEAMLVQSWQSIAYSMWSNTSIHIIHHYLDNQKLKDKSLSGLEEQQLIFHICYENLVNHYVVLVVFYLTQALSLCAYYNLYG